MPRARILNADVLDGLRSLEDESVQCCITSPPYWGLRDYGTAKWEGGDAECDHRRADKAGTSSSGLEGGKGNVHHGHEAHYTSACAKCGARRVDAQLGLEKTPEEYTERLVAVFREVRRVLRPDGVCFLNLGDSYCNAGSQRQGEGLDGKRRGGATGPDGTLGYKQNDKRRTLRHLGIKHKDLVGIPWRVAFALRADGWWLRRDIIWCLSGGTRVYAKTQKGEMPTTIKDLVRLRPETVKLWNGEKWTQVLGWNQSATREGALEIELRSGERIGCTPGHQWPTDRGNLLAEELKKGDVIKTCRLPGRNQNNPRRLGYEFGWFIGHYLAEGSLSGDTIQIACHARERSSVEKEWGSFAESFGGSVHAHKTSPNGWVVCVESSIVLAILRRFIGGSTAKTKRLKVATWRQNDHFLGNLLEGYFDGDAHYDAKNHRWRLGFTRNDRLADDLRTLAGRLGFELRLKPGSATSKGKRYPTYRGQLRKVGSRHHNSRNNGEVVAIRKSRARKFWDIGVEDPPHLFALASGVLTHNSKPNPMPESPTDRPTSAHEYVFILTKSARYFWDYEAVRERGSTGTWEAMPPIGGKKQTEGNENPTYSGNMPSSDGLRNLRSVWTIPTAPFPGEYCKACKRFYVDGGRHLAKHRDEETEKETRICACGRWDAWISHFACFPQTLVEPMVKAGSSEKGCCPECVAPWGRAVGKTRGGPSTRSGRMDAGATLREVQRGGFETTGAVPGDTRGFPSVTTETLGFRPGCECGDIDPVPCTILDPFSGASTTGLVALKLGRDFVGIELNPDYAEMARKRILQDAPLFNVVELSKVEDE